MDMQTIVGADGAHIRVHSVGSGPGLVVLHGAGISIRHYTKLTDRLAPHFTVHLYNRRVGPTPRH